jgi:hypothetical protein
MPDVAFTSAEAHRSLSDLQSWTYEGDPLFPVFVVEVDTLTYQSLVIAMDEKMGV